tara:strand:+ start:233 stop:427 length:195 start_codon:yes stop_codon:yes gene_type:complete
MKGWTEERIDGGEDRWIDGYINMVCDNFGVGIVRIKPIYLRTSSHPFLRAKAAASASFPNKISA